MPFDLDPLPDLRKRLWCLGHLGLNTSRSARFTEAIAALAQTAGWDLQTPTLRRASKGVVGASSVLIQLGMLDQLPQPKARTAWRLGWRAGAARRVVLVLGPRSWRKPVHLACWLAAHIRALPRPGAARSVTQQAGPARAFALVSGLHLRDPDPDQGRAALWRHLSRHHPGSVRLSTAQVRRAIAALPRGPLADDLERIETFFDALCQRARDLSLSPPRLALAWAEAGRDADVPGLAPLQGAWLDQPLGGMDQQIPRRLWLRLRLNPPQLRAPGPCPTPWADPALIAQTPKPLPVGLTLRGSCAPGSGLALNRTMLRQGLSAAKGPKGWRKPVVIQAQNAHRIARDLETLWLRPDSLVIGHCLWEYDHLPDSHLPGLARLDELWAPSRAVEALFRTHAPCPVHWVGKALHLPRPHGVAPILCPTFLMILDSRSGLARKNPLAGVRAFRAAFPPPARARLIVKLTPDGAEPARDPEDQRKQILAWARRDPRIEIVEEMVSLPRLLGLISSATAILSPHRGEGFGYIPAFALALGVPAIVSAAGGVLDFCTPATAWPVTGAHRPIPNGAQSDPMPNATWFEVDETALAATMAQVASAPEQARARATKGKALMAQVYSPKAYAARLCARLIALGALAQDQPADATP
ncbi:MAG: hypothetical protein AAFR93_11030 [Pseudomonadota bacterium]